MRRTGDRNPVYAMTMRIDTTRRHAATRPWWLIVVICGGVFLAPVLAKPSSAHVGRGSAAVNVYAGCAGTDDGYARGEPSTRNIDGVVGLGGVVGLTNDLAAVIFRHLRHDYCDHLEGRSARCTAADWARWWGRVALRMISWIYRAVAGTIDVSLLTRAHVRRYPQPEISHGRSTRSPGSRESTRPRAR